MPTITIPAAAAPALIARLTKLQKKAAKYGNADIVFNTTAVYTVDVKDPFTGVKNTLRMIDVTVEGDAPVYEAGWTLLARIELLTNENLVHRVPGTEIEMNARFRTHSNMCEHCNKARNRNDVYVFEKDGEQVAVGRTCLRDFIGMDDPKAIVERAAFWEALKAAEEEEMAVFFKSTFRVEDVLELTAAFVRKEGFISKAAAMDNGRESTSDAVCNNMSGFPGYDIEVTEDDKKVAADTLTYFRDADSFNNDYLDNLRVLSNEGRVTKKNFGLMCSAVSTYLRTVAKEAVNAEKAATSEYVGTTKERLRNVTAILEKVIYLGCGEFGDKFMFSFNAGGNAMVWFTGAQELKEGSTLTFDGTVKAFKEYNGVKQTILTRVSVK